MKRIINKNVIIKIEGVWKNMKLTAAKCPSCGANIEVDKNSDSTKCEYCDSKIIVEDAIAKYKVEISGEVEVKNLPKLDNHLKMGKMHYDDGEYEEAYKEYDKACDLDPDNYIAILRKGLSKALNTNYAKVNVTPAINAMKNSYKIAKSKEISKDKIYEAIIECETAISLMESFVLSFYKSNFQNMLKDDMDHFYEKL